MFMIETVSGSQSEILNNILKLYCPQGFDLDPTYSKGIFYKSVPEPRLKYDIAPQIAGVTQADSRNLPISGNALNSIVFDPPFIGGTVGDGKPGIIKTRFGYYRNVPELWAFYRKSLDEFYRILQIDGILVFKCQDTIESGKQYLSHIEIINYAYSIGFYPLDLFVLVAKNVLVSPSQLKQQHARKFHSYFLVFRKAQSKVNYHSNNGVDR